MKVTAVVTLSLAAALILLDFDPTTGIRLTNQYAEKTTQSQHQLLNSNPQKQKVQQQHHGGQMRSGDSNSLSSDKSSPSSSTSSTSSSSSFSSSSPNEDFKVDKKVKRGRPSQQEENLEEESNLGDMIESGLWPMPVHFWNYLPHTNSINNNHHHPSGRQVVMSHGLSPNKLREDVEEEEEDPLTRHHYGAPGTAASSSSNGGSNRHHLSYIPDPDNGISINVPSNEALGQRLAALNQHLFHEAAGIGGGGGGGGGTDYHPEDEDDQPHSHSPSLSILKRTSVSHSDSSSMGSRKTEDSKRANRPYDVPQIQCPPADDGMERFACPSPDRQGRYKCIDDHVLCDGFLDCPEGEDEDRHACMFYKTTKAHLDVLADALLRWARGKR